MKLRLFITCYAKLLATLIKQYLEMCEKIDKSIVGVDI
jgi:hypothetical protein